MFSRKFVVFSVASGLAFTLTTITPAQNQTTSVDVQIRNLMTQKRDVLKERLDGAQRLYEVGGIQKDRVFIALKPKFGFERIAFSLHSDVVFRSCNLTDSVERSPIDHHPLLATRSVAGRPIRLAPFREDSFDT